MTDAEIIAELQCYILIIAWFQEFGLDKSLRAETWFNVPNPMLGNVRPAMMIKIGRAEKLLKFIINQLEGNCA